MDDELEKMFERRDIKWKYIPTPDSSRLSVSPPSVQQKVVLQKAIEKTMFGTLFYSLYLQKNNPSVCIVVPDLDLILDSIKFIYELQKNNVTFQSNSFIIPPALKNIDKEIKDFLAKNMKVFKEYLYMDSKGPTIHPDTIEYDQNIYQLIKALMNNYDLVYENGVIKNMDQALITCKDATQMVLFIGVKDGQHANIIVVDNVNKEVERFEPHGFNEEDEEMVDQAIQKAFQGYTFIPQSETCPMGIQGIVEDTEDEYFIKGFCQTWSFLYGLMRITFPKLDPNRLMDYVVEKTLNHYQKYHPKVLNPEMVLNQDLIIEFLYEYIPMILEDVGKNVIQVINDQLGTHYELKGRTLYSTLKPKRR
jgi:hypothetical protein